MLEDNEIIEEDEDGNEIREVPRVSLREIQISSLNESVNLKSTYADETLEVMGDLAYFLLQELRHSNNK